MSTNSTTPPSTKRTAIRIAVGALIGALPGIIWYATSGFAGALPVLIFGAMIGAGLATPGTSPLRVAGGVASQLGVPGAGLVGDALQKADADPEEKDAFGEWLTTGTTNPRASRMMLVGLGGGVLAALVFFAADAWSYAQSSRSIILPNDWFSVGMTYLYLTAVFAVHFSAMLSLTVWGSHWKAILSLGAFGGVFTAIIWFSLMNASNKGPVAAFALLPSTFFLTLGLAFGAGAIEDRLPSSEDADSLTNHD